jgi:O-antigen biosynthesis protein WbqP
MKYTNLKRLIDFVLSFFILLISWPLLLIISAIIKIDSKGPVFFTQKRIGKDKKPFYILKFRTMRIDTPDDMPTHLLSNPKIFITRSGVVLRKTSLDELPQLINILKGEMSFVGPRPALWNQYDLISERDRYEANKIVPGLTGLAQVSGRDELAIEKKAMLDGEYAKNLSLLFDLKCLFKTFTTVLKADGVVEGRSDKELQSSEKSNVN